MFLNYVDIEANMIITLLDARILLFSINKTT